MKKYYKSEKQKRWNTKHAKRSLKKQIRFKEYRRRKNTAELGMKKPERAAERSFQHRNRGLLKIKAPAICSFIDNPIDMVGFISKLKVQYDRRQRIFVVLKNVKVISYDAIVVLLSIMVKFKSARIDFNGDYPDDPVASHILEESQFFEHLYKQLKSRERYTFGQKSSIHTHAWKDVDSELSSKVIQDASKTIWGVERRCQGVQRTMVELMMNTNNHADDTAKGEKHWWLSVHHDYENKKVSFAFIDFGVGIFTSLENKRKSSKWFGALSKLKRRVKYGNNADLLKLILDGTLHTTATGKPYRGKGLPGINDARKRKHMNNLHIITNNVVANVDEDKFTILSKSFSGTFVYWEVDEHNFNCNGFSEN